MKRRTFLGTVAASSAAASLASVRAAAASAPGAPIPDDRLPEATIAELQTEMAAGRLTSRRLVEFYTRRIASLDRAGPRLGHVLEVNPEAVSIAASLDEERRTRGPRGPLHGIPVLIQDNIATAEPELEPDGLRSRACGLRVWPPRPLQPLTERVER
jgi:amidase